jgi:hypothetical protein
MKKLYISAVAILMGVTISLNAQRQCGTMEHLEHQINENPALVHQMEAVEEHTRQFEQTNNGERVVINIPVVFHVVYRNSTQNISDAQIASQLTVLNNDFRKLNADASLIPSTFASVASDMEFNFCMAQRTPSGAASNGINRVASTRTSTFGTNDAVKSASTGGTPGWDPNRYLNVWVCEIGGSILGYATFPGTATSTTDGVVIDFRYFGTTGTATAPFNKGRTATHEVGHWLNLRHIWGDANCGSDLVNDTPTHNTSNVGCPTFPHYSTCTGAPIEMTMNYMDYTDDNCMYMFSNGQKSRAQALFASGGLRAALLTSNGCTAPTGGTTCAIPTGLTSTSISTTGATLSWSAASGAVSYNLEYKTAAATTWTLVNNTTTSRAITGLTANTAYNFRVTTLCATGNSGVSAVANFSTSATAPTCTDVYEPNESRTAAKTIPLATNVSARISSSTDKDYLRFNNTTAARNVRVTLTNLPADYDLQLFRGSSSVGISQNGGTTSESLIYNNTQAAATYTAYVYGYNGAFNATSCYTIRAEISGSSFVRQSSEEVEIVNAELSSEPLQVYPNPSNGVLNIRLQPEGDINQTVEVYNHLGQKVESYELSFTKDMPAVEVQLNDLTDGVYFIRVFDGEQVQTRRILLKK